MEKKFHEQQIEYVKEKQYWADMGFYPSGIATIDIDLPSHLKEKIEAYCSDVGVPQELVYLDLLMLGWLIVNAVPIAEVTLTSEGELSSYLGNEKPYNVQLSRPKS